MVVDNFNLVSSLINPTNDDQFYFGQIIARRKDNPDLLRSERMIKSYYIGSREYLFSHANEIRKLCKLFNARFYLNPNVRDYKVIGFKLMRSILDAYDSDHCKSLPSKFDSVCGGTNTPNTSKIWIIDIDDKDLTKVSEVNDAINKCAPYTDEDKIIMIVPTLSGYHILSSPFNKQEFNLTNSLISMDDIKTNSPTLVYYSDENE